MSINPMKALAAHRVFEKHGFVPKQEEPPRRDHMGRDEAQEVIERLKLARRYRSKIDPENRQSWPRGEFKKKEA